MPVFNTFPIYGTLHDYNKFVGIQAIIHYKLHKQVPLTAAAPRWILLLYSFWLTNLLVPNLQVNRLCIDHGILYKTSCGANWKNYQNINSFFQNAMAFWERIGKESLSEFPQDLCLME